MKKALFFLILISLFTVLYAEEPQLDETVTTITMPEKDFNAQLKFGFGVDFTSFNGSDYNTDRIYFNNQFGLSAGLDLNWKIFQQPEGEGAGEFFLGAGFSFQYWVPTTRLDPELTKSGAEATMHYMRLPVTLNISYDFKVDTGTLKRVGPVFSIGFNNNFFFFDYPSSEMSSDSDYGINYDETFGNINHWKISGTWAMGLNFLFENNWLLRTSIGGDFGNRNPKSELFYKKSKEAYAYFLYGHHEFIMFETGYRF